MATITQERNEFNANCFGCDPKEFIASVESSITFELAGPSMVIMSLLSDAQHELEHGMKEEARKTINRAKLLVDRYMNGSERWSEK